MSTKLKAGTATSGAVLDADTTGILELQSGSTPTTAVTIDTAQNVGIGTTPAAWYSTYKTIQSLSGSFVGVSDRTFIAQNWYLNAAGSDAFLGNGYASFYRQVGGIHSWNYSSASNSSGAGATATMNEAMRIDSSGNLLVGTSASPGSRLAVTFSSNSGPSIISNDTTPQSGNTFHQFRNNGTTCGTITSNGSTTTSYNTSSDYRLKENIAPMTGALDKVTALKPVTYTWKIDGSDGEGFIAHELAEVVPECVTGEKDAVDAEGKPVYQGIDTSFLVATLTAAIQELKAQVDAQAAEIATLKGNA